MIGSWMKNHLVSDNKCNIVSLVMSLKKKNKEWQIMLGLHSLLVTRHGRFTISIKQDKKNW